MHLHPRLTSGRTSAGTEISFSPTAFRIFVLLSAFSEILTKIASSTFTSVWVLGFVGLRPWDLLAASLSQYMQVSLVLITLLESAYWISVCCRTEILNFGEEKQRSVILDFYVVFVCSFVLTFSGVAAYVGWQSSSILKPLLQQGLSDAEEFVIYKALNALTCMCQLGLLQKPHIYEFACDIGKLKDWQLPCFSITENFILQKASWPA